MRWGVYSRGGVNFINGVYVNSRANELKDKLEY